LDGYKEILCFLDNDRAGRNAVDELRKCIGERIFDQSHLYAGYKDLNAYITGKTE